MILGLGLMVSVYLIFLVLPGALSARSSKLKNHMIGRTATLVIVVYLLFIVDSLSHWHGDVVFMDGLCKINPSILTSEIYILVLILAILHLQAIYSRRPELYLLILSNLLGLIYMISSNDWLITVTAWELFNLSLYLLTSINCESEAALSAAIKYFLLSALTTTFLLLSVALLYALTGSTQYDSLNLSLTMMDQEITQWPLLLMIIPFLLKLGAAPLHNVSIDLYDAIPTPITVYLINISKLAVLLFLMQIASFWSSSNSTHIILILAGIASMLVGSIGLGSQFKIKRFLTYSSISHLGFMLLALSSLQIDSFIYYVFIYFINSITIFAILLALGQIHGREILFIHQLAGLWKMNIPLALVFTLSIFSLAGIPPISGFFAKLLVLEAYISQGWFTITLLAIIASVISSANYLYLVKVTNFDLPSSITYRPISIGPSVSYLVSSLFSFSVFFMLKPASLLILLSQLISFTIVGIYLTLYGSDL
uniref:NADH-ubiquinone oxidoreductase chain 2 n=1 Tax=Powellomyces hirtus TaxID=109895 RepID=A0A4P8NWX5_9FUNG|nr:NADH dehydrogenase subunit 2 [Powellomyces hirtus]